MKKLSNNETDLKKSDAYKIVCNANIYMDSSTKIFSGKKQSTLTAKHFILDVCKCPP